MNAPVSSLLGAVAITVTIALVRGGLKPATPLAALLLHRAQDRRTSRTVGVCVRKIM